MSEQHTITIQLPTSEIIDQIKSQMAQQPSKRLLTVAEAAIYLGRTDNAIREMIRSGKLKAVKTDGHVMLDIRDLDAFIEAGKAA